MKKNIFIQITRRWRETLRIPAMAFLWCTVHVSITAYQQATAENAHQHMRPKRNTSHELAMQRTCCAVMCTCMFF